MSETMVFPWLERDCPSPLVAKILAFAGPDCSLLQWSTTSRHWQKLMQSEDLWRVLCEEFNKWKPNEEEPIRWRDHYKANVCVPLEFNSIREALNSALASEGVADKKKIRILLRHGVYHIEKALDVNVPAGVDKLTIETLDTTMSNEKQQQTKRTCRATLTLKTKTRNQPIFLIQSGALHLRNIKLDHSCYGNNYSRGNSAIYLEPTTSDANSLSLPSICLEHVEITSHSGQGLMNYGGGNVRIQNCYIHDCAATGVFVEAPKCDFLVRQSDIMGNGHAGVHLELGTAATVVDCAVFGNSSIGVSVYETTLSLELSDVVANGYQLETERTPKRLRKNNIMTVWWDEAADDGGSREPTRQKVLTRTPMAQSNFVHHVSKVSRLMSNRRMLG